MSRHDASLTKWHNVNSMFFVLNKIIMCVLVYVKIQIFLIVFPPSKAVKPQTRIGLLGVEDLERGTLLRSVNGGRIIRRTANSD